MKITKEYLQRIVNEETLKLLKEGNEWVHSPQDMFSEQGVSIMLNKTDDSTGHGRCNFSEVKLSSETPVDEIAAIVGRAIEIAIERARNYKQ